MLTAEDAALCPDPGWDSNSTSMMGQFGDLIPGALRGHFGQDALKAPQILSLTAEHGHVIHGQPLDLGAGVSVASRPGSAGPAPMAGRPSSHTPTTI